MFDEVPNEELRWYHLTLTAFLLQSPFRPLSNITWSRTVHSIYMSAFKHKIISKTKWPVCICSVISQVVVCSRSHKVSFRASGGWWREDITQEGNSHNHNNYGGVSRTPLHFILPKGALDLPLELTPSLGPSLGADPGDWDAVARSGERWHNDLLQVIYNMRNCKISIGHHRRCRMQQTRHRTESVLAGVTDCHCPRVAMLWSVTGPTGKILPPNKRFSDGSEARLDRAQLSGASRARGHGGTPLKNEAF